MIKIPKIEKVMEICKSLLFLCIFSVIIDDLFFNKNQECWNHGNFILHGVTGKVVKMSTNANTVRYDLSASGILFIDSNSLHTASKYIAIGDSLIKQKYENYVIVIDSTGQKAYIQPLFGCQCTFIDNVRLGYQKLRHYAFDNLFQMFILFSIVQIIGYYYQNRLKKTENNKQ